MEVVSKFHPEFFGLNVRRKGPPPSICVRSFSPITRKVPTQQDILAPSFKVAVSLTEDEALALAAELLSVVASRRGFQPESSDEEPE